jgi:hypothetical protein
LNRLELISKVYKIKSSLLWDYRLSIDSVDVESFIPKDRRVICTLNESLDFNCALLPDGKGNYFINLNKEIRDKLSLQLNDNVKISLIIDESKYGMPISPVFEELLNQDPEGSAFFHALTPGKIRSILYVIAKPKSEQKQLEKGVIVLEYLKEVEGKLDFRELNFAFKSSKFK